jgi:flagellar basal-body rod modification protein FlgD
MTSAVTPFSNSTAATSGIAKTNATSASSSNTSAASSAGNSPTLGQDAFLKLLVAQLSHQDPTSPMQGTEFVTQLSQFSLVEQSVAQSSALSSVNAQLGGIGNSQATDLVGKSVTINGSSVAFNGSLPTSASMSLAGDATDVQVTISDSSGNAVRTMDLGAKPAGLASFSWDGRETSGNVAPAGNYTIAVKATGTNGSTVATTQNVTGVVTSVNFSQGYAQLTLDSGATAPISSLVSVSASPTTTKSP